MVCSVAGITSDANVLTHELRLIAQRYYILFVSVSYMLATTQKATKPTKEI